MCFAAGDRVESKKKPPRFGNIKKTDGSKLWIVTWDSGQSEVIKSQAIKAVPFATALSPNAAAAASAASVWAGPVREGDAVLGNDESDSDAEDEEDVGPENIHAVHQAESWAMIKSFEGTKVNAPWQQSSKRKDQVWTVVQEVKRDDFPLLAGPPGTERRDVEPELVLIGYSPGKKAVDIVGIYLHF
jgi:hypothetical protein